MGAYVTVAKMWLERKRAAACGHASACTNAYVCASACVTVAKMPAHPAVVPHQNHYDNDYCNSNELEELGRRQTNCRSLLEELLEEPRRALSQPCCRGIGGFEPCVLPAGPAASGSRRAASRAVSSHSCWWHVMLPLATMTMMIVAVIARLVTITMPTYVALSV